MKRFTFLLDFTVILPFLFMGRIGRKQVYTLIECMYCSFWLPRIVVTNTNPHITSWIGYGVLIGWKPGIGWIGVYPNCRVPRDDNENTLRFLSSLTNSEMYAYLYDLQCIQGLFSYLPFLPEYVHAWPRAKASLFTLVPIIQRLTKGRHSLMR